MKQLTIFTDKIVAARLYLRHESTEYHWYDKVTYPWWKKFFFDYEDEEAGFYDQYGLMIRDEDRKSYEIKNKKIFVKPHIKLWLADGTTYEESYISDEAAIDNYRSLQKLRPVILCD
jgi:hypothetical protein